MGSETKIPYGEKEQSFKAFKEDYMATPEYQRGIKQVQSTNERYVVVPTDVREDELNKETQRWKKPTKATPNE